MRLTPEEAFGAATAHLTPAHNGQRIGVAVSGGGDSLALLLLAQGWAAEAGFTLLAATVDHGLREGSAEEAEGVAAQCAKLGIDHDICRWDGWSGDGNLQMAAREARKALLIHWADGRDIDLILLGHTADDQAETVLMRLARGSGVDGLAGMPDETQEGRFLRPLLGTTRAALREYLRTRNVSWVDDPSNEDDQFDRVKARRMMAKLEELGLTQDRLLQTSAHMRRAQNTMRYAVRHFVAETVTQDRGDLLLRRDVFTDLVSDHQVRALAGAVQWIGSAPFRPRFEALMQFAASLAEGRPATLGGCLATPDGRGARLMREERAAGPPVQAADGAPGIVWDGRWLLQPRPSVLRRKQPEVNAGFSVRTLGEEGLRHCPDWRGSGMPRSSLLASPSVWQGETLVAAPIAGNSNGWTAHIVTDFADWVVSH